MHPEEQEFYRLVEKFSAEHQEIEQGKMMGSPAIVYRGKVFAFLSRQNNMVFKLGKSCDPSSYSFEMKEFNPFKNKGPLSGWYEVSFSASQHWEALTREALSIIKS